MADLPFNPDLDKITERELVPNIYARLKLGDVIYNPDDDVELLLDKNTSVLQLTQQIINILPVKLARRIPDGVVVEIWNIGLTNTCNVVRNNKYKLIAAYLERSGIDIASLFGTTYTSSGGSKFSITFDDSLTSNDRIIAYLYEIN